jgi:hypothetical protein
MEIHRNFTDYIEIKKGKKKGQEKKMIPPDAKLIIRNTEKSINHKRQAIRLFNFLEQDLPAKTFFELKQIMLQNETSVELIRRGGGE